MATSRTAWAIRNIFSLNAAQSQLITGQASWISKIKGFFNYCCLRLCESISRSKNHFQILILSKYIYLTPLLTFPLLEHFSRRDQSMHELPFQNPSLPLFPIISVWFKKNWFPSLSRGVKHGTWLRLFISFSLPQWSVQEVDVQFKPE